MNEIVNKFLLAGDKFMPEMHLKQPGFTYSACGWFTKNKKRTKKFKETGDTRYIYKNEFDKSCFQHDMAYGDFKYLARRTASDEALRDKTFDIARNPKYNGYQRGIASIVYKFFHKKTTSKANPSNIGSGVNMQAEPIQKTYENNEKLAEELHDSGALIWLKCN